ncbi:MAG: hypothetical protein AB2729_11400, partial [Candidatus Thiodiazotropha taylori]
MLMLGEIVQEGSTDVSAGLHDLGVKLLIKNKRQKIAGKEKKSPFCCTKISPVTNHTEWRNLLSPLESGS